MLPRSTDDIKLPDSLHTAGVPARRWLGLLLGFPRQAERGGKLVSYLVLRALLDGLVVGGLAEQVPETQVLAATRAEDDGNSTGVLSISSARALKRLCNTGLCETRLAGTSKREGN